MKKGVGISKFLYRTPRIMGIVFLLFLTIFSFDVFGTGLSAWQTILALFMHNIPTLILLIILILSRKYEIIGGITFILAGLIYIIITMISRWSMLSYSFIIAGPAFLIGILFLMNRFKKKSYKK